MKTQIAAVLFFFAWFMVPTVAAAEREVFFALPTIKYEVSADNSRRTKLSSMDSSKNAIRIAKIGDDYVWKTRENRKLIYSYDGFGEFHYFIDPKGGGYVKIERTPSGKTHSWSMSALGWQPSRILVLPSRSPRERIGVLCFRFTSRMFAAVTA